MLLKQSTGIDVRVGPFVDATDGVTPEAPTLGAADQAELLKANGAATVDISARTFTAVTGCAGWYDLTLTTADTDTVGDLTIVIQDSSLMLPVFVRAQVVEEAIYDALYGASATGFDASGRVDVGAVLGTAQTAGDIPALVTTVDTVVDGIQTDLDNATDGLGAIKGVVDTVDTNVSALNDVSTADINAQVVDVLKTDTVSEMAQGAPPLAPTMEQVLNYLYRELVRNKVVVDTNTANQKQVFADDGSTILYEKDLTNASNVTTVAEATTGA